MCVYVSPSYSLELHVHGPSVRYWWHVDIVEDYVYEHGQPNYEDNGKCDQSQAENELAKCVHLLIGLAPETIVDIQC